MKFVDGLIYGTLIITETILIPYYEVVYIIQRANADYIKYKNNR
jgi:hypothetical protein